MRTNRLLRLLVFVSVMLPGAACQPSGSDVATAIAQTQAAIPTATASPSPEPTETPSPTRTQDPCPQTELNDWWLVVQPLWNSMADELGRLGENLSASQALTYQATALARASALSSVEGPRCTEDAQAALQDIFDAWARLLQAYSLNNLAVFETEASIVTEAITRFGQELRVLGIAADN